MKQSRVLTTGGGGANIKFKNIVEKRENADLSAFSLFFSTIFPNLSMKNYTMYAEFNLWSAFVFIWKCLSQNNPSPLKSL